MSLVLTVYDAPNWKAFTEVIGLPQLMNVTASISNSALLPVQSLFSLNQLMAQLPEKQFYIAIVQAEHFIADAIDKKININEAAKSWQQLTKELLNLQRKHRRQIQFFNLHQAWAYPLAFAKNMNPIVAIKNYPACAASSNLGLLIACQYVAQVPELRLLSTHLQAVSLPLCDTDVLTLDMIDLMEQNQSNQLDLTVAVEKNHQLNLELDKSNYRLVEQQQACNLLSLERDDLHKKIKIITGNGDKLLLQQKRIESEIKLTKEENNLILSQLHKIQEQLESHHFSRQAEEQKNKHAMLARDKQYAREVAKLENELRKVKARAAGAEYAATLLQKELATHRNSTIWKATGPVRALGRLVTRTDKSREKLLQDAGLLMTSEYFDIDWYLKHYPDVTESKMNPAEHYLLYGAEEGRLPGPLFDGNWYQQQYPDVVEAGINPLLHFITHGLQEGRNSSPKFLRNNQGSEE